MKMDCRYCDRQTDETEFCQFAEILETEVDLATREAYDRSGCCPRHFWNQSGMRNNDIDEIVRRWY